jgi:hypothetical protein
MPDGTYRDVPVEGYQSPAIQRFQDLQDGINAIEGMLSRGEIDYATANNYKQALRANFDAAMQGTTPYQQKQDADRRRAERMQSGQSLLNQRVSSGSGLAESLLNSAVNIVGNKNFMDPSAVEGFSPFSGAFDYVTELGGGQGVYDAARQSVLAGMNDQSDPATALLSAAFGAPRTGDRAPDAEGYGAPAAPITQNIGSGAASNPQPPTPTGPMQLGRAPISGPQAADDPYGNLNVNVGQMMQAGQTPADALLRAAMNPMPFYGTQPGLENLPMTGFRPPMIPMGGR